MNWCEGLLTIRGILLDALLPLHHEKVEASPGYSHHYSDSWDGDDDDNATEILVGCKPTSCNGDLGEVAEVCHPNCSQNPTAMVKVVVP